MNPEERGSGLGARPNGGNGTRTTRCERPEAGDANARESSAGDWNCWP